MMQPVTKAFSLSFQERVLHSKEETMQAHGTHPFCYRTVTKHIVDTCFPLSFSTAH